MNKKKQYMRNMHITELFKKSDAKSLNEFFGSIDDHTLMNSSYNFNGRRSLDSFHEEIRDLIIEDRKSVKKRTGARNADVSNDLAHLYIELCSKDKDLLEGEQGHNARVMALRIRVSIEMMIREGFCTLIKEDSDDEWNPLANDTYKVKGSLDTNNHVLIYLYSRGDNDREIFLPNLILDIITFNHKQKEEYDDGFRIQSNSVIESILKSKLPSKANSPKN